MRASGRRRLAVAVVAVGLVAAACSSGGEGDSGATAEVPGSVPPAPTTEVPLTDTDSIADVAIGLTPVATLDEPLALAARIQFGVELSSVNRQSRHSECLVGLGVVVR